jgi:chromosome segregation ATPase
MDEATPHLHVDFVPFTIGSKRGLDTRVSLKQALANQGFEGGARGDTEWNQWVKSEKEQFSQVMERHGIEWEQLGTHDEHLSVMDYKKVQRVQEVAELETEVSNKRETIAQLDNKASATQAALTKQFAELSKVQATLATAKSKKKFMALNARQYDDDPKYELPEPTLFMSAKSYRDNIASTLVGDLKDAIRSILLQFFDKTRELQRQFDRANEQIQGLARQNSGLKQERDGLSVSAKNFRRLGST